ncbi:GNAT family N-acetyltransferase [Streptomyces sp. AC495_CC817]|uniref:GNAT family N-acetyltransferase n=1 Tax=Streptomyces sp. AC495_CC817 TaxID=2823900 RepID=UPI0020B657F3|nr:GNAT family N-acetyltransferase [Streptomyces sp. AC495_CC817]
MRAASPDDAEMLLTWRNDPATRSASLQSEEVPLAVHLRWLEGVLSDQSRTLLVGELDGEPVGTVRFDAQDVSAQDAEVSITVAPAHRGRGLSRPLLDAGIRAYTVGAPAVRILARIRTENAASRSLFRGAGFTEVSRVDDVLLLEREPLQPGLSAAGPS